MTRPMVAIISGTAASRMWNAKSALRKLVRHGRGIQYVEHADGHGAEMFAAIQQRQLTTTVVDLRNR